MNPVSKALWYIESHFEKPLNLSEIAAVAGVSRFHLSRAFSVSIGLSVSAYLRGRRLSEAARRLADGAPDILLVALDAGYGSHEAFSRAFRQQFGATPEAVRDRSNLIDIQLVEPVRMIQKPIEDLIPVRFENSKTRMFAGINRRYFPPALAGIPSQWQTFQPHIGNIPEQKGNDTFGICHNFDDENGFEYMSATEVEGAHDLPKELSFLRISAAYYVVFRHTAHVSSIGATMNTIWNHWLPNSSHHAADAPFFERYGPGFDADTGNGGFEIWIPLTT